MISLTIQRKSFGACCEEEGYGVRFPLFSCIIGIALYRLFLDYIYIACIFPSYDYMGFDCTSDAFSSLFFSWGMLLVSLLFFAYCFSHQSIGNVILQIIYLLNFVPATSFVRFMPLPEACIVLHCIFWALLFLFAVVIPRFRRTASFPSSSLAVHAILFIFLSTVVWVSWKYTGFRLFFNLNSVYTFRLEAREYSLPGVVKYIIPTAKSCLPLLMVYNIATRKKIYAAVICLILLLLFSFDGSKTVIFTTVLAWFCYFFFTWDKTQYIVWGVTGISFLAVVEQICFSSSNIANYVVRRMMFVPQLLVFFYYDFFSENEILFYRDGFLGKIFPSPYNVSSPMLIGEYYMKSADCAANAGLFAESYANWGVFGCVISPLLIILLLRVFEYCSSGLDFRLLIVPAISIAVSLCSSALNTLPLTHGFLILCIICLLLPRRFQRNA